MCDTKEYKASKRMNARCRGRQGKAKKYYADRGVRVCPEWQADFKVFLAHIGPIPNGHRIGVDRIDNLKGYEPGNVRWATPKEQANNKRKRT